ncbi:PAS domain S-box protein [Hydrogenophaga sp. 5NK40-0174]|uniref:PAS domain S-box protein n=1 Tax=Hydrogenophaga sp. 5NK40-0174 TaxID=3127649 RepID=UPI003108E791
MSETHPLDEPGDIRREHSLRHQRSLGWLLLMMMVGMFCMATVDHVSAPEGMSRAPISLTMALAAFAAYVLFRTGRLRWVIPVMLVSVMGVTGWAVGSYGSVRAASTMGAFGVIVLAGTYLSQRALIATTLASALMLGVLTWAENEGRLPPADLLPDTRYFAMVAVILMLTAVILWHSRRATEEAHYRRLSQMEDRLRLEHERDRSLRRFRHIFHMNPAPSLIQSASTLNILDVNSAFERFLGFAENSLVGNPVKALWVDPANWLAHSEVLFDKGRSGWRKERWRHADGAEVELMVYSEIVEDPKGLLVLTTIASMDDAPDCLPGRDGSEPLDMQATGESDALS